MTATDRQVRRLRKEMKDTKKMGISSDRAGMTENTARKYLSSGMLPGEMSKPHDWRTRPDPFEGVWPEIEAMLKREPRLEAKTVFEDFQERDPGRFADGQLRTLQRRFKAWKIEFGPAREVMFEQSRRPGYLCQSDFTDMKSLGVTIAGIPFDHLLYHFMLPYSNWETGMIAFSESFESLAEGFQRAVFELGGVPRAHSTDRLTAAVKNLGKLARDMKRAGAIPVDTDIPVLARAELQKFYRDIMSHYGIEGRFIRTGRPNENGDVEQSHNQIKRAVDQALMLRGSRDFASRAGYEAFLCAMFARLNAGRRERFEEERRMLRPLPPVKFPSWREVPAHVSSFSLVRVLSNVYSVDSRLIGEDLKARIHAETIELFHGQRLVQKHPRLIGKGKARIDYRHVIRSLVRKPGAFAEYRYREELFPNLTFRLTYDRLRRENPAVADREYLRILEMAALDGEARVTATLEEQATGATPPSAARTRELLELGLRPADPMRVEVVPPEMAEYDRLHSGWWAA